jgi:transcriptional regulator with XRE-family HTH domain
MLSAMSFARSETPELISAMLGAILRREREAAARTLADVADAAGLSPAYLSEVERGRKEVSTERLITVARTLGISVAAIYRELAGGLDGATAVPIPADPQQRLRMAASVLSGQSLQAVADFSSYLLMREASPARRRIGFQPPGK